jgi:hypothetical protein
MTGVKHNFTIVLVGYKKQTSTKPAPFENSKKLSY